jgi:ribokinase
MIGCVGKDSFGQDAVRHLKKNRVNCDHIEVAESGPTGFASIFVDGAANNMICVSPGANMALRPTHITAARDSIERADIVVMQAEINTEVIERVFELAKNASVPCVFNPAPAKKTLTGLLSKARYITPNESETRAMTGISPVDAASLTAAFDVFKAKGAHTVIITQGKHGVSFRDKGDIMTVPAFKVDAVDSTGAGDVFNGVFAVGIAHGLALNQACVRASAAAALSVTRAGADAAPTAEALEAFLHERGSDG